MRRQWPWAIPCGMDREGEVECFYIAANQIWAVVFGLGLFALAGFFVGLHRARG